MLEPGSVDRGRSPNTTIQRIQDDNIFGIIQHFEYHLWHG